MSSSAAASPASPPPRACRRGLARRARRRRPGPRGRARVASASRSCRWPARRRARRAAAIGVFLGEVLVAEDERGDRDPGEPPRARHRRARSGDPTPSNDLPGVFSARALSVLSARGVEPTGPVAILGDGPWADELARRLGARALRLEPAAVEEIHGTGQVRAVSVRRGGRVEKLKVDAVAFATPPAPSFELAEQAGARVRRMAGQGFAVDADASGRAGDKLWAIGECTGAPLDLARFERDADALVAALLAAG